jgi:hypothetical protein
VAFACLAAMVLSSPAFAYRPFDGTDAAVADLGEFEVEFQPAGRLRDDTGTSLVAPDVVFNYGMMQDWEAVVEGRADMQPRLHQSAARSILSLRLTDARHSRGHFLCSRWV